MTSTEVLAVVLAVLFRAELATLLRVLAAKIRGAK